MTRISSVLVVLASVALIVGPRGLAAQLAPLGPEALLPAGDRPERSMLAVQPGGGYTVAWDDLAGKVFSHFVAAGDEAPGEGTKLVGSGLAVMDSVAATPKGFEVLWHTVNDADEPVAFYRRHLDPQGVPAPGKPVLLARSGVDWVWELGPARYLAGWFMDPRQAIGARFLSPSASRRDRYFA